MRSSLLVAVLLTATQLWMTPLEAYLLKRRRLTYLPPLSAAFLSTSPTIAEDEDSKDAVSKSSSSSSSDSRDAVQIDWDWQELAAAVFEKDKRPIVLFDGVCNLCNSGINFAMDQDETAKLRFCSLQSKVAQSLLLREGKDLSSTAAEISFITETNGYFSSNAVSHICMELDSPPLRWFGALGQYTPPWIRESIYQVVSNNRYQFGENDSCRLDFDGTYTSRFVSDPADQDDQQQEKKEQEAVIKEKKERK